MTKNSAVYVLFGATGDLAQRKIIPALYNLIKSKPDSSISIVAYSRRPWSNEDYQAFIRPALDSNTISESEIDGFLKKISYVQGTFDSEASYDALKNHLANFPEDDQRLFHFAVQPEYYELIVNGLGKAGLSGKILIEKPFGRDLESADSLQKTLEKYVSEDQIYRIDHYLAKPGLRSMNEETIGGITSKPVRKIHARMLEKLDIQGRGDFYDTVGVIRDALQNHVLEMIASCIMLITKDGNKSAARAKAIESLTIPQGEDFKHSFVRAQYDGYLTEEGVHEGSDTETYTKIATNIAAGYLKNVQVTLEAGKSMPEKASDITVIFSDDSYITYDMDKGKNAKDPYELLITEAIEGNKTYFVSMDEVRASWKFIDPIEIHKTNVQLLTYKKGEIPHN